MRLPRRKLAEVGKPWEDRAKRGVARRWVEATADEKELKEFANDVKQAVDRFLVNHQTLLCLQFLTVVSSCLPQ